tara:strand:+ start:297 stop:509 length:213 start_codon:yes stop_codon:yes gene_type:complete
MAKKSNKIGIKLNDLQYHEALDRLNITIQTIDRNLIQHPVLKLETEIKNLVEEAQTKLFEAYQKLGEINE